MKLSAPHSIKPMARKVQLTKKDPLQQTGLLRDFPWLISGLGLVLAVSLAITLLVMSQPLYMWSLYDRVLSSLSRDTLFALTAITLFLMLIIGALEGYRAKLLGRLADSIDEAIRPRLFPVMVRVNLESKVGGQAFSSLETVKGFFNSTSPAHLLDLPFAPLYLVVLFVLHPMLGFVALGFAAGMAFLGYRMETHYKLSTKRAQIATRKAAGVADGALRSSEIVAAMGMVSSFEAHWSRVHLQASSAERSAADEMAGVSAALKAGTMIAQTTILGLACYLVLEQEATMGALFVSNILVGRLVAPIQHAMMSWNSFFNAWEAWGQLMDLQNAKLPSSDRTHFPPPTQRLDVTSLWARPVGAETDVLRGVTFSVRAGEMIGLFGPSGAGKSTLCRALVGILKIHRGSVRLDGAPLDSWDFDELGPHIGYVPQSIDIMDGTVSENIRRFGPQDDAAVLEASALVGLHPLILKLPHGYDTPLFSAYGALSGGQRQRLALARAVYKRPKLLVLDEPNANLDLYALRSLKKLLVELRDSGSIIVIATHDQGILGRCDRVVIMKGGKSVRELTPSEQLSGTPLIGDGTTSRTQEDDPDENELEVSDEDAA